MKILLIGGFSNYAIERYYLKYFNEEIDVEAIIYKAQDIFLEYYQKNIFNKIIFRIGFQKIYKKINIGLKEEVNKYKPDIVFIFKGMEIFPQTIKWIREKDIRVVNYNPDNPFIFAGKGSGNSNIIRSIPFYDVHFTYNLETKRKIERKYKTPTYWLPFGFDISEAIFSAASSLNEIIKVCFVGNPDKARAHFLNALAEKGIKIDVYGSYWSRFVNHPNITLYPPVYNDELWFTLRKYRIQLNPLRIHNVDSHGMRSFEVPGIGGIMLAPRTFEHFQFFNEGREAFFYDNYEEAMTKINFLLALQKDESDQLRNAARERSIRDKYDYKSRAKLAINVLKNLNQCKKNIN